MAGSGRVVGSEARRVPMRGIVTLIRWKFSECARCRGCLDRAMHQYTCIVGALYHHFDRVMWSRAIKLFTSSFVIKCTISLSSPMSIPPGPGGPGRPCFHSKPSLPAVHHCHLYLAVHHCHLHLADRHFHHYLHDQLVQGNLDALAAYPVPISHFYLEFLLSLEVLNSLCYIAANTEWYVQPRSTTGF